MCFYGKPQQPAGERASHNGVEKEGRGDAERKTDQEEAKSNCTCVWVFPVDGTARKSSENTGMAVKKKAKCDQKKKHVLLIWLTSDWRWRFHFFWTAHPRFVCVSFSGKH